MGMVQAKRKTSEFNDFDLSQYQMCESLLPPSMLSTQDELGLLTDMEANPDKYVYVDLLGSTYLLELQLHPSDDPVLIQLEGAHFMNLIPKRYWYFAEQYMWDKLQWAIQPNKAGDK